MKIYVRKKRLNEFWITYDDGNFVMCEDASGNRMFIGTRWLFDECVKLGYFQEKS